MTDKVLIVEDDRDLRRVMAKILVTRGYAVVEAEDGLSAVSVARRERPDVILLDLGLPCGGGISVLERYDGLPELYGTPVIVLTGRDPLVAQPSLERFSVAATLWKPVDTDELVRAITDAISPQPAPSWLS